nr:type IV pilus secretin PilQ family protein [Neisseria sp. HSC-16F19]
MGLLSHTAWAGNITDINVSALPNQQKVIKIRFDRDVTTPSGFTTPTPARIALDFANTGLQLQQPVLQYDDTLLTQISAAENSGRSRVMLSLTKPGEYNTEVKGNEVWIYVKESTGSPSSAPVVQRPAATPAVVNEVRTETVYVERPATTASKANADARMNVDFRKGANNAGIIDVATGSFSGDPKVSRQADRLVFTYKNSPLPTELQRNLDVTDFSTPVRTVSLRRLGNDTQLTLRMQGNWDYRQNISGGKHSIEIIPNTDVASSGLKNNRQSFSGRRISLDFQDVDVRTILQILAKESGMNIVASDSVQGKMTISLKDVPWDQALDLVMQSRNLDKRQQGNIINIAPREELLNKDIATLESQNKIDTLGPLVSRTFQLKYKDVESFRKILRIDDNGNTENNRNTLLSGRGSALIDPETNTLIITDINSVIQKFERLVRELDVPAQQVMVEARIVEATDGFSRELGVRFGGGSTNDNGRLRIGGGSSGALGDFGNSQWGIPNVNLPIASATSALTIIKSYASGALGLELQAMQAENRGKIISSPRVLTQDRRKAVIEAGDDIPYQEATSSGATSITFKKAVLGLTVTPQITPDGNVIMDIEIQKDSPYDCTASGMVTKCIDTKNLVTKAMVEDGGTLILGGIYTETNTNTENKVPLLGDIPVVGNLFKSRVRNQERKELLVFITPRIINSTGSVLRY